MPSQHISQNLLGYLANRIEFKTSRPTVSHATGTSAVLPGPALVPPLHINNVHNQNSQAGGAQ